MRGLRPLLCLLIATACNSPTGPTVSLNERFTLAPGEVASVRGREMRVRFVEVTGDSRCPADALCIQGGDALVHIEVTGGGSASVRYELHTGDASLAAAVHRDVRIALVELQPFPFSSRTIAQHEYRASFTVAPV